MDTPATCPVILQVLPALAGGGVEQGTLEMVQAIVQAGGRALVASAGGAMQPRLERAGAHHYSMDLQSKSPFTMLANARRLRRIIRRAQVDIVHARSRAPAWSAWLACHGTSARFLTTWHGSYAENLPGKRLYNAIMARGEIVIAISQHIATQIATRHHVPPDRIRVVPRGVDPAVFDPKAVTGDRLNRLATQWRLPPEASVILLPARLSRWKGQGVAIEAFASIAAQHPQAWLVMPGRVSASRSGSAYMHSLLSAAGARQFADRVRLPGDCADMPAAYALAEIVLSCSTTPEAFGRTVVEAQSMARVVIATAHGGAAETVDPGRTGLLVQPGDPADLAAALDQVLGWAAETRQSLGEVARAAVMARYTTAAMQRATLDIYDELLRDD